MEKPRTIIREYLEGDKKSVIMFVEEALFRIFNSPAQGIEDLSDVKKNFEKFWVVLENDKIIGALDLKMEGERARVSRMYVEEKFRGNGIGKMVYRKLYDYCKERRIKEIFLTMPVKMKSRGFYEKMGFKFVNEENDSFFMETKVIFE